MVAARSAWLYTTPYLIRALDRRPQQRLRRVGARARVASGVAGFRGAVSLAAALAVPQTVASGAPFPGRSLIIFVTAGVIVVTLVGQGLALPGVVRWARLPHDTSIEAERQLAETLAAEDALAAIPNLAAGLGTDPEITRRLRREYEKHLRLLSARDTGANDEPALRYDQQYTALRLAALARKRATVLRLRDERRIDDTVLLQLQARLDIEEVRLSRLACTSATWAVWGSCQYPERQALPHHRGPRFAGWHRPRQRRKITGRAVTGSWRDRHAGNDHVRRR